MKPILATTLLTLATTFIGTLALPGTAQAQLLPQYQTQHLDGIVAVVEDQVILESDLAEAVATVKQQFAGSESKLPPADILNQQILDRLVLQKLQVQRAQRMGIRASQEDVSNAIEGIARQNGMNANQMQQALASRGTTVAQFQRQIADQIIVQKLRQQVLQQKVQVTESEIDNLLNSPIFQAGEVHLAHITIRIPQGASPEEIASARDKAMEVEQQLNSGMSFEDAAIRYSEASNALQGGDLGWTNLSEMPESVAETLSTMQDGQVSPPIRDPGGFHIFKVLAHRDRGPVMVTEYHARHLSIRPDALTTESEAEDKINQLRQKITSGDATFADVAKAESDDDTTANQGGDMGWFPLESWGSAVAQQLDQLNDGEISQPFFAGGAWHIIKRLGTRDSDRTAETRREQARAAIETRKSSEVYDNFLRQLRAESYVDIRIQGEDGDADKQAS